MPSLCFPRRPTSGSVLSPLVPSRHAALYDPGEFARRLMPIYVADDTGLRAFRTRSAFPSPPPSVSGGLPISGLHRFTLSLRPVELLASLTDPTGSPQPQRRLLPG